jgi:hypothetical protein
MVLNPETIRRPARIGYGGCYATLPRVISAQSRDDATLQKRGPGGVSSPSQSSGNADMLAPTLCAKTGREQMQQMTCSNARLLDHLVGEREEPVWHV